MDAEATRAVFAQALDEGGEAAVSTVLNGYGLERNAFLRICDAVAEAEASLEVSGLASDLGIGRAGRIGSSIALGLKVAKLLEDGWTLD